MGKKLTPADRAATLASSQVDLMTLLQVQPDNLTDAVVEDDMELRCDTGKELAKVLKGQTADLLDGNPEHMLKMLNVQAYTLNKLFHRFARTSYDTFQGERHAMVLAMKAQNQCRRTLQAMAEIATPKQATFIGQQNNGANIQVNNGEASDAQNEAPVGCPEPIREVSRKKA